MINIMNCRIFLENIPLGELINYIRIWITAVENEMKRLLSAKPSFLWVESNAWLQRGTSSLYITL